jgi:hypothetical protein
MLIISDLKAALVEDFNGPIKKNVMITMRTILKVTRDT